MQRSGRRGDYNWIEVPYCTTSLASWAAYCHPGLHLCIVAGEDGPIHPASNAYGPGWASLGHALVSPPLGEEFAVESADVWPTEWYVVDRPPPDHWRPEIFSRLGGFSLASPRELVAAQDATWDWKGHDWLIPHQEQFWDQIECLGATSYVLSDTTEIIVSRCSKFIKHLPGED